MISALARVAENLDSALARAEMSPLGTRRRLHHANDARRYLARIVAAAERRIDAIDPPATPRIRDGGAPAENALAVPDPGERDGCGS